MKLKLIVGSFMFLGSIINAQSIEEGIKLLENEQFTKAKSVFTSLLAKKPIGDNYYYMGNYFVKIEEYDSAKTFFNKGIETEPKNGLNYVGLGVVQWLKGDTNNAKLNFDKATSIRKRDADVYYEIAQTLTYNDQKSLTRAMYYIDQALIYNKENANFYLTKGDIYILKNDGTNAASNYNEALKVNPKSVQAYIRKGKLYLRAKNTEEALKLYKQGIDLDPNYAPAYRERSEVYFSNKRGAEGLVDYQKYLSITDDNFDNNLRFAKFLLKNKEFAKAVEICEKLEKSVPDNLVITRIKAYSYAELGQFDKAKENLDKVFKSEPIENMKAYDFDVLGQCQLATADTANAMINKVKAADLDKRYSKNYVTLATMFYDKKKYAQAAELYTKGFDNNLLDFYGKLNWGKSYYFLNDYTKSNEIFTKLTVAEPQIPNWFVWKLKCEVMLDQDYKTDNIKIAVEKFVESTDKLTNKTQYNKSLAEAYTYLGSYHCINKKSKTDAEIAWKKALEFDANYKAAQNALANIAGCK